MAACCGLLLHPATLSAQAAAPDEVVLLGANVLLGGTTSALIALVDGRPILPALGRGAAGGAVAYGGKRIASAYHIRGSGLAGRAVGAVGASMVRNGAAGRGMFDMIVLPMGPLTMYLRFRDDSAHAPVKLNLARAAYLALIARNDAFAIDWLETLHTGAPLFRMTDGVIARRGTRVTTGMTFCGTVLLSDLNGLNPPVDPNALLAHERVHVLQDDFASVAWTGPAEAWLLRVIPGGRWLTRYVEVGALQIGAVLLGVGALPYEQRPWEIEADVLESVWHAEP